MSPMPERTSKTEKMIASTDKLIPYLIRFMPYKKLIMTNSLLLFKKRFCGHFARQRNPDHIEQRWRDIREDTARILERIALVRTIDQDERHGSRGMRGERRTIFCDHAICITVISRNERHSPLTFYRINDRTNT